MIHFIINRPHEVVPEEGELIIKSEPTQEDLDFIINLPIIGFDYEANSLDPYIVEPILLIIGDKETQYVFDCETYDCIGLLAKIPEDRLILGANLKYDYKIAKVKHKHIFGKMFDVMIAEQRLLQGITEINPKTFKPVGISCSLENIVKRRLGILPDGMDKSVRQEFIGANPKTFVFKNKHIKYGAADIKPLFDIRDLQKEAIANNNLQFLIYGVEFPAIRELADAELEGFIIDEEKWKENIRFNKQERFIYQCKLDDELRRLRDTLLPKEDRGYLSNGVWDRQRQKAVEVIQDTLFGDMFGEVETVIPSKKKTKQKPKEPYINYGSTTQLIYIFGKLKQKLPTKEGQYAIPTFTYSTKAKKEKLDKLFAFTTGEGAIESYLMENPGTVIKDFVELLIKYREYTTRLNTFGENFLIKFKNPITKKFHTIFRQCHAVTGRLQSGDKDNGWFNSQNIPAEKRYREAFKVEDGYSISTTDLSGAEAVIMIDKARDEKFYEIAILNDDAHSPLCQAVWRAIGRYRLEQIDSEGYPIFQMGTVMDYSKDFTKRMEEAQKLSQLVVSKSENKHLRTAFKPMTFGSIYGMYPKKTAKTLNITVEEAKVALKVMKSMIPKTFKMVENNASFALNNGYLILNHRTNSKIWYNKVLEAKRNKSDLDFKDSSDIAGSARNCPIQGTQADMVKEMIVEIGKEYRRQNIDSRLLIQVHDELVYKHNDKDKEMLYSQEGSDSTVVVTPAEFVKLTMCKVANRYLSFIKMTAEQHNGKTWTK